jgi:hypothetical protein
LQYIHVFRCLDPFPIGSGTQSSNMTTLAYIPNAPNNTIQSVNISVTAGQVIGVLGIVTGVSNSYGPTGVFNSDIGGNSVTLNRLGYQGSIESGPAPSYWGEANGSGGQIGRIELYYSTGPPCNQPTLPVISAPTGTICAGDPVTLSISSGTLNDATNWQWYTGSCGGTSVGSGTSINVSPMSTTTYYARGMGGCVSSGSCASAAVTIATSVTASVSINAPLGTNICSGEMAGFNVAAITNGGSSPAFQWKVNGQNIAGANGMNFFNNNFNHNDQVSCMLTSSSSCASPNQVTSNVLTLSVAESEVPQVLVVATPGSYLCPGKELTLTAYPTHGGTSPTYVWKKNGTTVSGASTSTLVETAPVSGDYFDCIMTSNLACVNPFTVSSNKVTVSLFPAPTIPTVWISGHTLYSSISTGNFWYRDNVVIPGASGNSHQPAANGWYKAGALNSNGCLGFSDSIFVDMATIGLQYLFSANGRLSVFPSPFRRNFSIAFGPGWMDLLSETEILVQDQFALCSLGGLFCYSPAWLDDGDHTGSEIMNREISKFHFNSKSRHSGQAIEIRIMYPNFILITKRLRIKGPVDSRLSLSSR